MGCYKNQGGGHVTRVNLEKNQKDRHRLVTLSSLQRRRGWKKSCEEVARNSRRREKERKALGVWSIKRRATTWLPFGW